MCKVLIIIFWYLLISWPLFFSVNCDPSVETVKAQREMYTALKARKEALEEAVNKKLEELKQLCIQEGVSVKG